eukprot:scaffold1959_cov243-Pinguiococcus_pyrenoidosus.AAC.16
MNSHPLSSSRRPWISPLDSNAGRGGIASRPHAPSRRCSRQAHSPVPRSCSPVLPFSATRFPSDAAGA